MDAAQALADLTEISAQIDGAVLADTSGALVASTFAQEERGKELARAAAELLAAAAETRGDGQELVQVQAAGEARQDEDGLREAAHGHGRSFAA